MQKKTVVASVALALALGGLYGCGGGDGGSDVPATTTTTSATTTSTTSATTTSTTAGTTTTTTAGGTTSTTTGTTTTTLPPDVVAVTPGATITAAPGITYQLPAGSYEATISGFDAGNKLDFPFDSNPPSVFQDSFSDGKVKITNESQGGNVITVFLTDLGSKDQQVTDYYGFKRVFGEDSIK